MSRFKPSKKAGKIVLVAIGSIVVVRVVGTANIASKAIKALELVNVAVDRTIELLTNADTQPPGPQITHSGFADGGTQTEQIALAALTRARTQRS